MRAGVPHTCLTTLTISGCGHLHPLLCISTGKSRPSNPRTQPPRQCWRASWLRRQRCLQQLHAPAADLLLLLLCGGGQLTCIRIRLLQLPLRPPARRAGREGGVQLEAGCTPRRPASMLPCHQRVAFLSSLHPPQRIACAALYGSSQQACSLSRSQRRQPALTPGHCSQSHERR